jgi:hypothetical protein
MAPVCFRSVSGNTPRPLRSPQRPNPQQPWKFDLLVEESLYCLWIPSRHESRHMNVVVVGGHTRNIGKTSVMAGLIRNLRSFGWTAVKITQYGHGICSRDGQPCECAPTEHPFVLTEEQDPNRRADSSRFLAAGARRSLWLRVRQGQLGEALPLLAEALGEDTWVIIESNSILGFVKPALYLMVLDSAQRDFKHSAREFLHRADALVPIHSRLDQRAWKGLHLPNITAKPVFPVTSGTYSSPELRFFVKQKLEVAEAAPHHALTRQT